VKKDLPAQLLALKQETVRVGSGLEVVPKGGGIFLIQSSIR
jgi:hypothetical protein